MQPENIMKVIGDYDIVVDNPKKHLPYAIFCSTFDAYIFMQKLKKEKPKITWQLMKLIDWQKIYEIHS